MSLTPNIRRPGFLLLGCIFSLGLLSGCKQAPAPAPGVRNSDGSITNADGSLTYPAGTKPPGAVQAPAPTPRLNADGSTTNPDGSVTYPANSAHARREGREEHPTSAPAFEARREQTAQQAPVERRPEAPPPPAPVARILPVGTVIRVTTTQALSASHNEPGDTFNATLSAPIRVNDSVAFERGANVAGTVTASKRKGRFKGAGDLVVELNSINGVRISTSDYEAVAKGGGKRTTEMIGGGAGLGALIGGLAGGGKGALIGGLAGAGAGTAGAAYTGNRDVIIPSETPLSFTLTAPLTLR